MPNYLIDISTEGADEKLLASPADIATTLLAETHRLAQIEAKAARDTTVSHERQGHLEAFQGLCKTFNILATSALSLYGYQDGADDKETTPIPVVGVPNNDLSDGGDVPVVEEPVQEKESAHAPESGGKKK